MKGTVERFCDIAEIEIPSEMLAVSVDGDCAEKEISRLSLRYAVKSEGDVVKKGDIVFCDADEKSYPDSRTVVLFTGVSMPAAEEAAKAVVSAKKGDKISTVIADKNAVLTVKEIMHLEPAKVDDELIKSIGIEGISTVAQYSECIKEKTLNELKTEKVKEINFYVAQTMLDSAGFSYDENEMNEFAEKELNSYIAAYGEEELGDKEETKAAIVESVKRGWLAKAFCEKHGIEIDMTSIEEDVDRMIEMTALTGESVPEREELIEMSVQNEYIGRMFECIEKTVLEKMEA